MLSRVVFEWNKKLHMYAGLLTFTAFVVWGVIGIYAVFLPGPGNHQPPEISSTKEISARLGTTDTSSTKA